MRIGLLVGSPVIGGTERQVALLAQGLAERGAAVTVFFMVDEDRARGPRVDFGGVEQVFIGLGRWRRLLKARQLRRLLEAKRIEILHAFNLEAIAFGSKAAAGSGTTRVVGSVRGIRFSQEAQIAERLKAALAHVRRVTVNAEMTGHLLLEGRLCDERQVVFIPNGVSIPPITEGPEHEALCILFAASLKEVKNPGCFVEAAKQLAHEGRCCRFVIAGDGVLRESLTDQVRAAGLTEVFEFLGNVSPDQVPYAQADLVVSTSWREGASNSLLEAMAHGVPVVATDVGGSGELLRKGEFGVLVPAGDPNATARAIGELLDDPPRRQRLGANGRSFIEQECSVDLMVSRHKELYRQLLESES